MKRTLSLKEARQSFTKQNKQITKQITIMPNNNAYNSHSRDISEKTYISYIDKDDKWNFQ